MINGVWQTVVLWESSKEFDAYQYDWDAFKEFYKPENDDYKYAECEDEEFRKLYRIGRGEQSAIGRRLYTNDICAHWRRLLNENIARKSADKIYSMFCDYKEQQDFIGMDMVRSFLKWDLLAPAGMQIILVGRSTLRWFRITAVANRTTL